MGDNKDLCELLGLPRTLPCPICGTKCNPRFYDYDIEAGESPFEVGKHEMSVYCEECEHFDRKEYFTFTYTVSVKF